MATRYYRALAHHRRAIEVATTLGDTPRQAAEKYVDNRRLLGDPKFRGGHAPQLVREMRRAVTAHRIGRILYVDESVMAAEMPDGDGLCRVVGHVCKERCVLMKRR